MKKYIMALMAVAFLCVGGFAAETSSTATPIEVVVGDTNGVATWEDLTVAMKEKGISATILDSRGSFDTPFSVSFTPGVVEIEERLFAKCALVSVSIGKNITKIGYGAFLSYKSLTDISVDDENPCYLSVDGILFNKTKTELIKFPEMKPDSSYIIPDSVITIGDSAFSYCDALTNISIPNSVTTIGEYSFFLCSSLTNLTIPNSVTSIGGGAFSCCYLLESITIPNSVKQIRSYTFSNCVSLKNVDIPDSVTLIGECAFDNCNSLTDVIIPKNVTFIGGNAFASCESLTGIVIPNSLTKIASRTFVRCSSLTDVTIPDSVDTIGMYAFWGCVSLTELTLPNNIKKIGYKAFYGCGNVLYKENTNTEAAYMVHLELNATQNDDQNSILSDDEDYYFGDGDDINLGSAASSVMYTVEKGDCLWSIAEKFLGDGFKYALIYEANRELIGSNPDLIYPGQALEIPNLPLLS